MTQDNTPRDLISIVIPVYNTGKYLINCLQSCMDQTYSNVEIIVVDDHSTDPVTLSILKDFEQKDPRFRMIYCSVNRGQSYCRNLGVKECKGKYFAFVDSDDYLMPEFAEKMYAGILEFDTDFVICDISKDFNDPSIHQLRKGFKVNNFESQFNLIHARDRTVIKTSILMKQDCLAVFPATCYGKLFNVERYRASGVAFAEGEDARHCEDQDWKVNVLIHLKDCLILKFVGYMRVVRLGSVGSPSLDGYRCGISADYRFYMLVKDLECFNTYAITLLRSMFDDASNQSRYTGDFNERQQIIPFLSKYLEKCDPSLTLNPYLYSSIGSIGWYDFFQFMDSHPLGLMYFSVNPLHDVLSTDCTYVRELFECLASQGMQITSFNGSCSDHKSAARLVADIQKDFLKGQSEDDQAKSSVYKSSLFLFKDNGVTYIAARTSTTPPETFTNVDKLVLIHGVQKGFENSFKVSRAFDPLPPGSESVYSDIASLVEGTQNTYLLRQKYKKHEGNLDKDKKKKRRPREIERLMRAHIIMVSGGDLVTQQVCRLLQTAGCKVIYFINSESALPFTTLPQLDSAALAYLASVGTPTSDSAAASAANPAAANAGTQSGSAAEAQAQAGTGDGSQAQAGTQADAVAQALEENAQVAGIASIVKLSQNLVPADLDALIEALNEQSKLNHEFDVAVISLEAAKKRIRHAQIDKEEKIAELKKAKNLADDEELDDETVAQMFSNEPEDKTKRVPTTEELENMEKAVKENEQKLREIALKVAKLRANTLSVPSLSKVDPNYLFAPQEFDAVVSFTPELAKRFEQMYGVKAQALGYLLNPVVNQVVGKDTADTSEIAESEAQAAAESEAEGKGKTQASQGTDVAAGTCGSSVCGTCGAGAKAGTVAESEGGAKAKAGKLITFPHPVLENGLAIFIKLMQAYTQRHPEAKFLVVQEPEDNFVQDIAKLHDGQGKTLAQLKLNLSAMSVASSKKFNPISVCTETQVLLKLGLNEQAAISNIPEALINHIPVLATNQPRYAAMLQNAGKLLSIPASTLKDPSCLPSDEEILPYVEALEALVQGDYTAQCQNAAEQFDYRKNVEAWSKLLYEVVGRPFTHNHPGDERHL